MLSGCGIDSQIGHETFEQIKEKSPGMLSIMTTEGVFLYLMLWLNYFLLYAEDVNESPTQNLMISEIYIPPDSGFIGQGYQQYAESKLRCKHLHPYHICLILKNVQEVLIAFA